MCVCVCVCVCVLFVYVCVCVCVCTREREREGGERERKRAPERLRNKPGERVALRKQPLYVCVCVRARKRVGGITGRERERESGGGREGVISEPRREREKLRKIPIVDLQRTVCVSPLLTTCPL